MKNNFAPSLALLLKTEGGFNDDPEDGGGPTNKGITQAVYDGWRIGQSLPKRSVRYINDYEVGVIYKKQYWDACRCDDLTAGVDYCVFDFGVNSGTGRASRYLQAAVHIVQDGKIGPATIAAAKAADPRAVIDAVCDMRIAYLKQLKNFSHFGNGWLTRVADVDAAARKMVQ